MGIILGVLKVLGILLLVILGILLVSIFLVLFYPIRYKVSGSYYEEWKGRIDASWLFSIFKAGYSIENGKSKSYFRILWIPLGEKKSPQPKRKAKKKEKEIVEKPLQAGPVKEEKFEENVEAKSTKNEEMKSVHTEAHKKKGQRKKKYFINPFRKIKETLAHIREMIKKVKDMIGNESYQMDVKHILNELIWVLKKICPKRMKLNLDYSFGSPDYTALFIGAIACFPIAFQNEWKIHPDFKTDEMYFKGEAQAKGRVILFPIVVALVRIVVDKNCRKLYNDFSN